LRFERRDYASAIKHGRRALELPGVGTTERQIHYLLARAYGQAGQKELAEVHLTKFRAAQPTLRR
jgi:Flp pilus assembly protein TadD